MENQKKMNPPQKVRIIEAKYLEDSNLFSWTVRFLSSGKERTYVWTANDLLACLNIKGKTTSSMLNKFCSDIKDKEINLVLEEEPIFPSTTVVEEYQGLAQNLCDYFGVSKRKDERT